MLVVVVVVVVLLILSCQWFDDSISYESPYLHLLSECVFVELPSYR